MRYNRTQCDKMHVKCDQIRQNATNCMFSQKRGRRVKTNFIWNRTKYDKMHMKCDEMWKKHTKCDKMHVKCDRIKQNVTKYMFCQKCGRRVKANSIRNVMKYDKIVTNVTKYTWSVIKSDKTGQNACFSRSAVEGSTQIHSESYKMWQNTCEMW